MTEGAPLNEAHTRARIDAVLFSTLAAAKREERSNQNRMSSSSTQSVRSVHLQFEKDMKMEWTFPNKQRWLVTGRTDYSLWYGEPGQMEANLVVCEAKRKGVMGVDQTLVLHGSVYRLYCFLTLAPIPSPALNIGDGLFRSTHFQLHRLLDYFLTNNSDATPGPESGRSPRHCYLRCCN